MFYKLYSNRYWNHSVKLKILGAPKLFPIILKLKNLWVKASLRFVNRLCMVTAKPSTTSTPWLLMKPWKLKNNLRLLKNKEAWRNTSKVVFLKAEPFAKERNTGKSPRLEIFKTVLKDQFSKSSVALLAKSVTQLREVAESSWL